MDVNLEALVVGLFAVLPGFLSSAVRATLVPDQQASTGQWIVRSVVASLVLNALAVAVFLVAGTQFDLSQPIKLLSNPVGNLPTGLVLKYVGALYLLAILSGTASGLAVQYAPRTLAHRFRLTPVSPTANVFNDTIEKLVAKGNRNRGATRGRRVPWLLVRRENLVLLGRLRHGSVDFDVDKPVEVFLSPSYRVSVDGPVAWETLPGSEHHGVYLRLLTDDIVEVLMAPDDWLPKGRSFVEPSSASAHSLAE